MTRANYGTGSMTERAPGVYRFRVYDRTNNRQVSETFKGTEKQAHRALAKFVSKVDEGKIDRSTVTVKQLLERWIAQVTGSRRPSTIAGYKSKIDTYLVPHLGDIKLSRLGPDKLDAFYGELQDGLGLADNTVHQVHAILSAALNQAVKWGWVQASVTKRASPPSQKRVTMHIPAQDELNTLYRAAQGDPILACAIALATLTGARRGELCALRWSDVDLTKGIVHIRRSLSVVADERHEGPTKTHQERTVALDPIGVRILKDRWAEQRELANRADSPLVADPYVLSFRADGAEAVGPDTLTHRFRALADKQGMTFRFHDLRHFAATQLIGAGVDVRTVAGRLGHADASTTLRVYAHALPERDRRAAGILGRALEPPKKRAAK